MQKKWDEFYKSHDYFHLKPHSALPSFIAECNKRGISKVLDLGCGAGSNLLALAEVGFEVTGVDFSPAAATNAEDLLQSKNLPGKVYVDNLFDSVTTFLPAEFPAVIAVNSLEYTDTTGFKTAIAEVTRTLDDNGLFLLVVSSEDSEIALEVPEQLFFSQDKLTELVVKRFSILDFMKDEKNSYSLLLEKK